MEYLYNQLYIKAKSKYEDKVEFIETLKNGKKNWIYNSYEKNHDVLRRIDEQIALAKIELDYLTDIVREAAIAPLRLTEQEFQKFAIEYPQVEKFFKPYLYTNDKLIKYVFEDEIPLKPIERIEMM